MNINNLKTVDYGLRSTCLPTLVLCEHNVWEVFILSTLKKRERRVPVGAVANHREYPRLTFEQAIDFVISAKRSEGLHDRSLSDYVKRMADG